MILKDEMKEYLKNNLKEKRYIHTLGVAKTAVKLAKLNGVSEEKAECAGLAHDIAKNISKDEMLLLIKKYNIKLTEVEKRNSELWHSLLAPFLAKEKFKIDDEEILSSLRYHTTGKENMTKLEKIIYISDMIEPSRSFEGLSEIRDKTFENLDKGVFLGLSRSIGYILNKNQLIDENTIKARNYFLYDENFL